MGSIDGFVSCYLHFLYMYIRENNSVRSGKQYLLNDIKAKSVDRRVKIKVEECCRFYILTSKVIKCKTAKFQRVNVKGIMIGRCKLQVEEQREKSQYKIDKSNPYPLSL